MYQTRFCTDPLYCVAMRPILSLQYATCWIGVGQGLAITYLLANGLTMLQKHDHKNMSYWNLQMSMRKHLYMSKWIFTDKTNYLCPPKFAFWLKECLTEYRKRIYNPEAKLLNSLQNNLLINLCETNITLLFCASFPLKPCSNFTRELRKRSKFPCVTQLEKSTDLTICGKSFASHLLSHKVWNRLNSFTVTKPHFNDLFVALFICPHQRKSTSVNLIDNFLAIPHKKLVCFQPWIMDITQLWSIYASIYGQPLKSSH